MRIEFPEFLPDLASLDNPGTTVAKNVIPGGRNYKQVYGLGALSTALTARARGGISAREAQFGTPENFVGDQTKLYRLGANATWADVSKAGGYSLADDDQWTFTQFGEVVLAANLTENIQAFNMSSSSLFADLAGSPPKARYIATARDFVFVANTFDGVDGFVPNRVRWAGIGTSTSWTVSATTQADYQDLDSKYGWIYAIVGGEYLVVFQERAITRFDYIGSPTIFQVTVCEIDKGTVIPKSPIQRGNLIDYIGLDGFYTFDGNVSHPIGDNKVNQFFYKTDGNNNAFLVAYPDRVWGAVDYNHQVSMWTYPTTGDGTGASTNILYFNYTPNARLRWSYAETTTEMIFGSLTQGYTLDQIDDYQTGIEVTPNIDATNPTLVSFDSAFWSGGGYELAAFNSNHVMGYFVGVQLTAQIETAEVQINEGWKTDVMLIRPLVDGSGTVTVQIGTRNLLSESVTYGSPISLDSDGNCQVRSQARYHRLRVNIATGFNDAIGFEILDAKKVGVR